MLHISERFVSKVLEAVVNDAKPRLRTCYVARLSVASAAVTFFEINRLPAGVKSSGSNELVATFCTVAFALAAVLLFSVAVVAERNFRGIGWKVLDSFPCLRGISCGFPLQFLLGEWWAWEHQFQQFVANEAFANCLPSTSVSLGLEGFICHVSLPCFSVHCVRRLKFWSGARSQGL